jgi:hypothetical protein
MQFKHNPEKIGLRNYIIAPVFLCGALQLNQKTHPNKGHSLCSYRRLDWGEGHPFEQGLPILFEPLPC